MRLPKLLSCAAVAVIGGLSHAAPLAPVPQGPITVTLEDVLAGGPLSAPPTKLVGAGDGSGRRFVTLISGEVLVLQPDNTASLFLDTTNPDSLVVPSNFGMTSIAFHPGFADPQSPGHRRLYTITTEARNTAPADFGSGSNHQDVVIEWQADATNPDIVDVTTKREILRVDQPGPDHNVVDLAFTNDELLLITSGDGNNNPPGNPATSVNSQDIESIHGKVLRIDPLGLVGGSSANGAYTIPFDNPFYGAAGNPPGIDEIYAYGVRSPFRISVDPWTDQAYLGDVGQNTIEEINRIVLGGNYGWNLKEGSFLFDTTTQTVSFDGNPDPMLINPLGQYDHDGGGRSICGGYVYRGSDAPILGGRYILADFQGPLPFTLSSPVLFAMDVNNGTIRKMAIDPAGAQLPELIYSLGEDDDGEIYILGSGRFGSPITIQRVTSAANPCAGDIDADGDTDVFDFAALAANFGQPGPFDHADGDLNDDQQINVFDFSELASDFGCSTP